MEGSLAALYPVPRPERDVAVSLHAQISHNIRQRVASGEWPPNYRLPPEPELARQLGVSRGTLRRALGTLIEEGALRQIPGRGTFVTSTVIEPAIAQKLSTLSEDLAGQGILTTTTVLAQSVLEAPKPIARLLDVVPGQGVLRLVRLRSGADGPLALLYNYVRTDLAPGIEEVDFTLSSLFGALEQRFRLRIASGRRTFSAESATGEVASALNVQEGTPVQYLEQVTYLRDGRPVEYSDVWINSRRLRITSLLSRR
jgi:DNA-binding GntR family transcriptional regulator